MTDVYGVQRRIDDELSVVNNRVTRRTMMVVGMNAGDLDGEEMRVLCRSDRIALASEGVFDRWAAQPNEVKSASIPWRRRLSPGIFC